MIIMKPCGIYTKYPKVKGEFSQLSYF